MARVIQFEGQAHTFPDDFTDDEIAAALAGPSQYRALPPAPQPPQRPIATQQAIRAQAQMSGPARFAMGVARPVLETAYGVQELLGGELTPEQRHQLEVLRNNPGFAGGAGRVAGELATFAAPGGVVSKGASLLPRARAAARVAGDIATTAGMEALKSPTDERSRAQAALEGAAGAGLGHAVAAPVAPFLRGVRNVTPSARAFMAEHPDVVPTLGQMKNGWARGMEERATALPFIGEQIKRRQREALEQWNRDVTERALPPLTGEGVAALPRGSRTGQESIAAVQDAFGDAYDDVFKGKQFDLSGDGNASSMIRHLAEDPALPSDAAERVTKRLGQIADNLEAGAVSGTYASRVDDQLREFARSARQNGFDDEAGFYEEARKAFRAGLPKQVDARLAELDTAYRQWVPVERAAAYKGATEGIFTPSQLLGASRASSDTVRKRGFAAGRAPQQREAQLANRVLGSRLPEPGPGTAEKILGPAALVVAPKIAIPAAAGLLPYSRAGQKMLAGKYPWQPPLKTITEMLAERGVTPGTVGAAIEE